MFLSIMNVAPVLVICRVRTWDGYGGSMVRSEGRGFSKRQKFVKIVAANFLDCAHPLVLGQRQIRPVRALLERLKVQTSVQWTSGLVN